jgi:carboxymethylenebutenolidase
MHPSPSSPFAKAAGAVSVERIVTPSQGLETQEVRIATQNGQMPAYFAKPTGRSDLPIVLVAQEIFGLHEHIRDIARRFAALGYLAVAPDFFFRAGDPLNAPDIAAIRAIVTRVSDVDVMTDFDAALAFAETQGGDAARAAITGFCWGGRTAWLYAAYNPRLRASIPWYGRLDGDKTQCQPHWPVDIARKLRVPTLGLYGGADSSIPLTQVEEMRARLLEANAPAEIVVYDEAPHAFLADYRDSYRLGPAQDAWSRMLAFLRAHGVE